MVTIKPIYILHPLWGVFKKETGVISFDDEHIWIRSRNRNFQARRDEINFGKLTELVPTSMSSSIHTINFKTKNTGILFFETKDETIWFVFKKLETKHYRLILFGIIFFTITVPLFVFGSATLFFISAAVALPLIRLIKKQINKKDIDQQLNTPQYEEIKKHFNFQYRSSWHSGDSLLVD